jgi:serine protease Do
MSRIRPAWRWATLATAVTGLALLALMPAIGFTQSPTMWTEGDPNAPAPTATMPAWVEIAKAVKPAVVNVTAKMSAGRQPRALRRLPPMPEEFREFFRRFDPPREERMPQQGRGSGFIISKDGHIVTSNHIVDEATEVTVKVSDGREFTAKVVGTDPKTDIALLKIQDGGDLPVIPLGDSSTLQVGEPVMAVGNPFGLEQTVTTGIVSATGRVIGGGPYDDFIQTDASVNPGNSGGPLVNARGEAVGINTAIFSRSGGSIGIGFAVPINMAKFVVPQLAQHGKVERGWLGVTIQSLTPELARSFNIPPRTEGALVSSVFDDSPAAKVGLKPGDVIVEFDGRKIGRTTDLSRLVAATPASKPVALKVWRDGKELTLSPTIARLEDRATPVAGEPGEEPQRGRLGLAVEPLTPELAQSLGTSHTHGLVVRSVQDGSPADEAGLRPGDLITEVNRKPVRTVEDLRRAVEASKEGAPTLLLVYRDGNSIFVTVKS